MKGSAEMRSTGDTLNMSLGICRKEIQSQFRVIIVGKWCIIMQCAKSILLYKTNKTFTANTDAFSLAGSQKRKFVSKHVRARLIFSTQPTPAISNLQKRKHVQKTYANNGVKTSVMGIFNKTTIGPARSKSQGICMRRKWK